MIPSKGEYSPIPVNVTKQAIMLATATRVTRRPRRDDCGEPGDAGYSLLGVIARQRSASVRQ